MKSGFLITLFSKYLQLLIFNLQQDYKKTQSLNIVYGNIKVDSIATKILEA